MSGVLGWDLVGRLAVLCTLVLPNSRLWGLFWVMCQVLVAACLPHRHLLGKALPQHICPLWVRVPLLCPLCVPNKACVPPPRWCSLSP